MNILRKISIFNDCNSLYTGGICHKNFMILLNPNKSEVRITNKCFSKSCDIKTEQYVSITENKCDCYFILTKKDCHNFLYKVTYDFLEFDSIELHVPDKYKGKIEDIYYNEEEQRIYIVTGNYIYSVTLDGYFIKEEKSSGMSYPTSTVMKSLNGCCKSVNPPVQPPKGYTAIGKCNHIYYSYIKDKKCYLEILDDVCHQECIFLGENIRVTSIMICNHKMYLLVIKNERYNYLYEMDLCCCKHTSCKKCECSNEDCDCKDCNCHHCSQDFCDREVCCSDKIKCHCKDCDCHHCSHSKCHNSEDCHEQIDCHKEDCDCKDCNCHHPNCHNSIACVLQSIALEQTALSHILNAEGEKIQKAIKDSDSTCELLAVNESVRDTIFNTTMLEHVLYRKMEKALDFEECNRCTKEY